MDTKSYERVDTINVRGVPLGVAVPPSRDRLLVSLFASDLVLRFKPGQRTTEDGLAVGQSPSLLDGPYPRRQVPRIL